MILKTHNNKLSRLKEVPFKLEKQIQNLVEENMDELLGVKFLVTEFKVSSFRLDSVAYDEESNAFVIVEYKKGVNESLVDQGLTYLTILLNCKADFVLMYNNVNKTNRTIKDFDWSQTRIVFISPKFTTYQRNANSFSNFPFKFYQIRRYENGLVEFNELKNENKVDFNFGGTTKSGIKPTIVENEIKVYSEETLLANGSDEIQELYEQLKNRILQIGDDINVEPKKLYVVFKTHKNICEVIIQANSLKILIDVPAGKLIDNNKVAKLMFHNEGNKIGHWGSGDYQCIIKKEEELDTLMPLIRQAYSFE